MATATPRPATVSAGVDFSDPANALKELNSLRDELDDMIKRVDAVADSGEDLAGAGRRSGLDGRSARSAADRIGDTANEVGKHLREAVTSVRETQSKVRKFIDTANEATVR